MSLVNMIDVNQEYTREVDCEYKGEKYKVRDNGAILRMPREGKPKRPKDQIWTFGETISRGYAWFCGEAVHRIVAVAFLGEPPTKQHVVDHIDTNRQNNRPENLRWLTKLENILLNPITKAKIEYLCGSVEEFLENPSQLSGHENEDANFAWMRAVSSDEARNTLISWEKLLNKSRMEIRSRENPIEEWIFGQNRGNQNEMNFIDDVEFAVNEDTKKVISEEDVVISSVLSSKVDEKVKERPISKTEFMSAALQICEREGWRYKKYYKADGWKADVFISKENQSVAISAFNSVSAFIKSMPKIGLGGVKWYGLILSPKKDDVSKCPCFSLLRNENIMDVAIADNKVSLDSFIKKALDGKIEHITRANITAVDVLFEQIECYFCHEPHYIHYVRYLIDEKGKKWDLAYIDDCDLPDLRFGKEILEVVKSYIENHPEKGVVMGEVKKRYSRTMEQSYMSFGCPKCDGILGDFYLRDLEMCLINETDEQKMDRIQLKRPFEVTVSEWVVKD